MNLPMEVAVDAAGNIYIADTFNDAIRKTGSVSEPRLKGVVINLVSGWHLLINRAIRTATP
jgi:hypothetical protein